MENRKLNRLPKYDYSHQGYYFVTVCTKDRKEWFGKIENGKMVLNECGSIVSQQWQWLAEQYSFVQLDEFVVMPNHIHGIIVIVGNARVGNGRDRSLRKIKSLSEVMGAFKTTSSKSIHLNGFPGFQWQKSFYDHIIRKDESLDNVRVYIQENPMKWDLDQENIKNQKKRAIA